MIRWVPDKCCITSSAEFENTTAEKPTKPKVTVKVMEAVSTKHVPVEMVFQLITERFPA